MKTEVEAPITIVELATQPQPDPLPVGQPVQPDLIEYLHKAGHPVVAAVIRARTQIGIERYGQYLYHQDGRNTDAEEIQELSDALIYAHKGVMANSDNGFKRSLYEKYRSILTELIEMGQALIDTSAPQDEPQNEPQGELNRDDLASHLQILVNVVASYRPTWHYSTSKIGYECSFCKCLFYNTSFEDPKGHKEDCAWSVAYQLVKRLFQ